MEDEAESKRSWGWLNALRQHRHRFLRLSACENESDYRLQTIRELFENTLLSILNFSSLDDPYAQFRPGDDADGFQEKLNDLLSILDEAVNPDFISGTPVSPQNDSCPQMKRLVQCLGQSQESLSIACGGYITAAESRSSLFLLSKLTTVKSAKTAAEEFLHCLKGPSESLLVADDLQTNSGNAADAWARAFEQDYRVFLEAVLSTLQSNFMACPHNNDTHEVLLQFMDIADHRRSSEASLGMFLSCPDDENDWICATCKRDIDTGSSQTLRLCEITLQYLHKNEENMLLRFPSLDHSLAHSDETRCSATCQRPQTNLTELAEPNFNMSRPSDSGTFSFPQRRSLAAMLALQLLIFCNWSFMSRPWESDEIFFPGPKHTSGSIRPHIQWKVGQVAEDILSRNLQQPVECFTKFAKLLLDIEYGFQNNNATCSWRKVKQALSYRQDFKDQSRARYLKAVEACLQFHNQFKPRGMTAEEKLQDLRVFLRTHVVSNLLADLDEFKTRPTKRPRKTGNRPATHTSREDANRRASATPERSGPMHSPQSGRLPTISVNNRPHLPLNGNSLPETQATARTSKATEWYRKMEGVCNVVCEQRQRNDEDDGDKGRVRVVVIDTGIDKTHPAIREHLASTFSRVDTDHCKNFVVPSENVSDTHGHGTAVCDIILSMAKVCLCVAKVSNTERLDDAAVSRISEAITWAAEECDADIIVMALGFPEEKPAIATVINRFPRKIFLAAASNDGNMSKEWFPASLDSVLSIRSADINGKLSRFSPDPTRRGDNFMVLGEEVKAAGRCNQGRPIVADLHSGTSFATAVAAGIAALVLEFSVQRQPNGELHVRTASAEALRTPYGMRKVFNQMALGTTLNTGGPVLPWNLFTGKEARRYGPVLDFWMQW
ncbi:nacht and wd40 domain protein [Ophiostoma piceae UAMH 11346]|uniref:Nacht and wd40 domain protein n=1 Tax=Ophiostoma piceae (strain UAMH 11346) TaxID=1262450 RepID=S3C6W3_OPHP1|nr:nacht and wd40 domain protein [Ophiostoma piceae UAMH 11346]